MKKVFAVMAASALALCMVGCGSSENGESEVPEPAKQEQVKKDFDGSAFSDTGDGVFYISTPDGTSENGNVPKLIVAKDTALMQIGCGTDGMEYAECAVYVDGMENDSLVVSEMMQGSINLQGDALKEGVHTVELVKMEGGAPVVYKIAQYEVTG